MNPDQPASQQSPPPPSVGISNPVNVDHPNQAPATVSAMQPELINPNSSGPPSAKKSFTLPLIIGGGVILILAIAVGAYMFLRSPTPAKPATRTAAVTSPSTPSATAIVTATPELTLTISTPSAGLLVNSQILTISGKTNPNVSLVIYSDSDANSVTSDAQGNYSGTVLLDKGINTITVTAFTDQEVSQTVQIKVVYDDGTNG